MAASGFDSLFSSYSKFGDTRSDGQRITLSNSDKWMRSAGLLVPSLAVTPTSKQNNNNSQIRFTSTETGIEFKKIAKTAKAIDKSQYDMFIDALVRRRIPTDEGEDKIKGARLQVKESLVQAGPPTTSIQTGTSSQTDNRNTVSSSTSSSPFSTSASGEKLPSVIARLTDHTKYTGSHKLRFDQETGKGKGKAGRE